MHYFIGSPISSLIFWIFPNCESLLWGNGADALLPHYSSARVWSDKIRGLNLYIFWTYECCRDYCLLFDVRDQTLITWLFWYRCISFSLPRLGLGIYVHALGFNNYLQFCYFCCFFQLRIPVWLQYSNSLQRALCHLWNARHFNLSPIFLSHNPILLGMLYFKR